MHGHEPSPKRQQNYRSYTISIILRIRTLNTCSDEQTQGQAAQVKFISSQIFRRSHKDAEDTDPNEIIEIDRNKS